MTSMRRIAANRENAKKSTGPRSAEGKARVAQNAIGSGLLCKETLLPDEDPQEFDALVETMQAAWTPANLQEQLAVKMMIRAHWRLSRLARVEAGIFAWHHYGILAGRASHEAKRYERSTGPTRITYYGQPAIPDPKKHQQAMATAEQMSALRKGATATVGLTFIRGSSGADAFSKLSRYEAAIQRSYYRALHELQRLQHARRGGQVPPPLALDVTVSGRDDGEPDDAGSAARQPDQTEPSAGGQVPPPVILDVTVSGPDDGEPDDAGSAARQPDQTEPSAGAAENEGQNAAAERTRNTIEDELFG